MEYLPTLNFIVNVGKGMAVPFVRILGFAAPFKKKVQPDTFVGETFHPKRDPPSQKWMALAKL